MNLVLSLKFHGDGSNLDLIKKIKEEAKNAGHETKCIITDYENGGTKQFSPNELMKITFEVINSCDAVIVDLSEKGVGVGIEAGYAFAKNIPIYVIAKKNSDISDTLMGISKEIYFYESLSELKEFFSKISI